MSALEPVARTVPTEPIVPEVPPRKKRRAWIVVLVVLVVLGIVAFFVADAMAKNYARDYVRERIVQVLALPEDADVEVDLGGGSIILQALAGRISTVDVAVPEVAFGALAGSAKVHAEGVPLDQEAPVEVLHIDFLVDESDLGAIASNLSGVELESIALEAPEIAVTSTFNLFGLPVALGVTLLPSAEAGEVVFTPIAVSVAGEQFAVDDLRGNPLFGAFAGDLLQQQSVCIAASLPQALVVTDVDVVGDRLVLSIRGDGAALGGPELSTLGTCAD